MRFAKLVMQRIEALGKISEDPQCLTRRFCSPAMRKANKLVASWMRAAGMIVRKDAIGNLIGRYPALTPDAKTFLLGSHLDTVCDAGKFDGPLGILVSVACVQELHHQKIRLPFAVEIIAFCDEEGARYQSAFLGSKVLGGDFNPADLKRVDEQGITMADAIRSFGGNPVQLKTARLNPSRLLGYAEVHIEQGPVLEKNKLAVGIVSAISGQTRCRIQFIGRGGHAGTTPMNLRKDALCAAAEFITAVERYAKGISKLVATVGQLETKPGVSNVIPAYATLSFDLRHRNDVVRTRAEKILKRMARGIARRRKLKVVWEMVQETSAVPCSPNLSHLLTKAARPYQKRVLNLPSGAGHDAAVISKITPVAMLFVRCKSGISHHPDESVKSGDVQIAIKVMSDFLQLIARDK